MSSKDKFSDGKRADRLAKHNATSAAGVRDFADSKRSRRAPEANLTSEPTAPPAANAIDLPPSAALGERPAQTAQSASARSDAVTGSTKPESRPVIANSSPPRSSTAQPPRNESAAAPLGGSREPPQPAPDETRKAAHNTAEKESDSSTMSAEPAAKGEPSAKAEPAAGSVYPSSTVDRQAAPSVAEASSSLAEPTAPSPDTLTTLPGVDQPSPEAPSPGLADAGAPPFKYPISLMTPAKPQPPRPAHVDNHRLAPEEQVAAVLRAEHRDPFAFLGMHAVPGEGLLIVRAFVPTATSVTVIEAGSGASVTTLSRIRDEGLFAGGIAASERFAYRLRVEIEGGTVEIEDPYRFGPVLSDADIQLLAEGRHLKSYERLGAHPREMQGVAGVAFAVWAPHAGRVAVIGDFNGWDGRRHGMRLRNECGVWEIFIPGLEAGGPYKYEIKSPSGDKLPDRTDPYAFQLEKLPGSAAIVCDVDRRVWQDAEWMEQRRSFDPRRSPIAIYQVHLGSWRRKPEEGHRWLTYQEHAEELVAYVRDMGFTHVQLMPISEFDDDASLGYQPSALYAPTRRWGTPEQFGMLVERCHRAGIGVIADWTPGQFAANQLGNFDGASLYEHPDPGRRRNPGANTLNYDYGRREVANFLTSNALYWLDKYHLDGLRVPSVEAMLYLDYARAPGEWTPNRFGGTENLEAIDFLRRLNEDLYASHSGIFTVAEENSSWQRVSHPTFAGGLGFGFRWYTSWVRDTLRYLSRNPVHRKYYHHELLQGPAAAFSENYILPLSHAEVSIGKGSMLSKMTGDRWQKFAQLRAYYALMYTHPGKKLLFMGDEFAQEREWNSEISLDWHMLDDPMHLGVQRLVRDLNALYRSTPALHELDCEPDAFAWIDCSDSDQSVISFQRLATGGRGSVAVVCNFTPVARPHYRLGVPEGGFYQERLNSDAQAYGGVNIGNEGGVEASAEPMHGRPFSLALKLPPFATVVLEHRGRRNA